MGRKKKNFDDEVMDELFRIIRASPERMLRALEAGEEVPEVSALAAVKCKRGADGSCEWEIKTADKLKAIELYLRHRCGVEATGGMDVQVDYDYG